MVKKILAVTTSLFLLTGIFAGCSKAGSPASTKTDAQQTAQPSPQQEKQPEAAAKKGTVHVKLFTGKIETIDVMNDVINRFNAENSGIVVEQEYQKEASNVIKVKFASGDVPDIVTVYEQEYVDQGKYLDLSDETAWWSRVLPSIKEACTDVKTGKQFRIATNMTMAGLYYNKKIFNELGIKEALTWEEFKANLKAVKGKKPDVTPMFICGKEAWSLGHLIEFLPHGIIKQKYGATEAKKAFLSNDQEKLDFGKVGGSMEVFAKRMLELKSEGLINSDVLTATYDNQISAFAGGKAAVISQGMWALGGILAANPEMKDIGFSPYPSIMEGTKPVILSAEDSGYAIAAESKNQGEAKKFMEYLFKPENLKLYSETIKSPCSFTDVNADWGVLKDEVSGALQKGFNIGFTNEKPAGFPGDDAGRLVQELLAGKYTSEEFAAAYKDKWDKGFK